MKIPGTSWLREVLTPRSQREAEQAAAADAATVEWASRILPDMHPIEQATLLTNLDADGLSVPGYQAPGTDDYHLWARYCAGGIINSASYERFWAETLTDPDDQRTWDPEPTWPSEYYGGLNAPDTGDEARARWKESVAYRQARDEREAAREELLNDPRRAGLLEEQIARDHEAAIVDDQLANEGMSMGASKLLRDWSVHASQVYLDGQDGLEVQEEAYDNGISPTEYTTPDPTFTRADLDDLDQPADVWTEETADEEHRRELAEEAAELDYWLGLADREADHPQALALNALVDEGLPVAGLVDEEVPNEPDEQAPVLRVYRGDETSDELQVQDLADAVTDPWPLNSYTAETPLEKAYLEAVEQSQPYRASAIVFDWERNDFARSFLCDEARQAQRTVSAAEDMLEDEL